MIETLESTIIVSDLSSSMRANKFSDDDEEFDLEKSELEDSRITKQKAKISKECSIISDRLVKLEKKKKSLELPRTKSRVKKNMKASKASSKNAKSTRKFHIKDTKLKSKLKRKKNKE